MSLLNSCFIVFLLPSISIHLDFSLLMRTLPLTVSNYYPCFVNFVNQERTFETQCTLC